MSIVILVITASAAALLSFSLTPLARRMAFAVGAIDLPNERKVHHAPVPRLGGVAVLAAIAAVTSLLQFIPRVAPEFATKTLRPETLLPMLAGLLPVVFVSIWDDVRPLRSLPKFAAHVSGALLAATMGTRLGDVVHLFGWEIQLGLLAIPISVIWIAGVTNAFNLVDGLDGLSAGLAFISSASLVVVSLFVGRTEMAFMAAVVGGALLGFLPFNSHPARIFLGDSGAASIGFILACLALSGGSTLSAGMAIAIPIVVLGLPIAEALVSMSRRALRRLESRDSGGIFQADRGHFHHKLLDLGLDHRRAVLTLYAAGLVCAATGIASLYMRFTGAAVLLTSLLLAAVIGIGRLQYDEFAVVRRGTILKMYDVPALRSGLFIAFFDIALALAAAYGAIVLKYDDWGLTTHRPLAQHLLATLPAITIGVYWLFKLYQGAWRLAGVEDFVRVTAASGAGACVTYIALNYTFFEPVPVTFVATFGLLLILLSAGSRASYRVLSSWNQRSASSGEPVLIYGAGVAGAMALRAMLADRELSMKPVGFIDDDETKVGKIVQGFPIHSMQQASHLLESGEARGIVVSSDKITLERLESLRSLCASSDAFLRYFRISFGEFERNVTANQSNAPVLTLFPEPPRAQRVSPVARTESP